MHAHVQNHQSVQKRLN